MTGTGTRYAHPSRCIPKQQLLQLRSVLQFSGSLALLFQAPFSPFM